MPPKRKNNNAGSTEVASDINKKQRATTSNDDAKCDDNEIVDLAKNRAKEESFATEERDENNNDTEVTNPTTEATTESTKVTTDVPTTEATEQKSTEQKSTDNQIIDVDTKDLQQQQQQQHQVIQSKEVGDLIVEQIRDDAHPTTVHQIIHNKDNTMYAEQLMSSTSSSIVYENGVQTEVTRVTQNDGSIKVTTVKSTQDENGKWIESERNERIE